MSIVSSADGELLIFLVQDSYREDGRGDGDGGVGGEVAAEG